jgi:2-pyrone-4,6-dicarboxylate lactonase
MHAICPGVPFSADSAFAEVTPLAQVRIAAQLICGSDHPPLSFSERVGTIGLRNQRAVRVPDEAMRRCLLADNPVRLFGA